MNWAPLWAHSGFMFEHFNGCLLEMVKSSNGVPHQIVSTFQKKQILNVQPLIASSSNDIYSFLNSLTRNEFVEKSEKNCCKLGQVSLLGKATRKVNDTHRLAIVPCTGNIILEKGQTALFYDRVIVDNVV